MENWAHCYQIDAFTTEPYRGNPAAICLMPTALEDKQYLAISSEMNLSETAFMAQTEPGVYHIRWFISILQVFNLIFPEATRCVLTV